MTTLRFARVAQAPRLVLSMVALLVVVMTARAEFQFSSFLGSSITMPSDVRTILPLRNTDLTYHGVQWYTDPLGSPPFYGFQGAYYFTNWNLPNWGIGWDYTHNKIIAHREDTVFVTGTRNGQPVADYERLDTVFQRLEMTDGLNMLTFNVLHRWFMATDANNRSRIQPYVGAGMGLEFPNVETQFVGEIHHKEYEWRGPAFHALAGLNFVVREHISLFLEYKYDYMYLDVNIPGLPDMFPGGRQLSFASSHQFTGGWRLTW